jgi:hypothetical protein
MISIYLECRTIDKSTEPVILSIMHHSKILLDSTSNFVSLFIKQFTGWIVSDIGV